MFSSEIFAQSGISPQLGNFLVGLANFLGCFVPILIINSKIGYALNALGFGRKTLLLCSYLMMGVAEVLLVFGSVKEIPLVRYNSSFTLQLLISMIMVYLVGYQTGAGSIPYSYLNEICTDSGMTLGIISLWFWSLSVTIVSPFALMTPSIGIIWTFAFLALMSFLGFFFTLVVVKETKGLTDDQCKELYLPAALKQQK